MSLDDFTITNEQLKQVMRGYGCHGFRVSSSGICLYGLMEAKIVDRDYDTEERWQIAELVLRELLRRGFIKMNISDGLYDTTTQGYQFAGIEPYPIVLSMSEDST